jgi:nucleoside-diphosphate kinase
MKLQRTLIILKPHALARGIVGEVITRFERAGLKIVASKMVQPTIEHYHRHYEEIGKMITRRGQKTFEVAAQMMSEGPVIAFVLEGVEAVALVRKMVGSTEPKSALPGTIRGDYAHLSFGYADEAESDVYNVIHASGDPDEAEQEVSHWFAESEIFDYTTAHDVVVFKKK